jgi:hypothetical protein
MIMKKFLLTIAAMVSLFAVSSGTAWAETVILAHPGTAANQLSWDNGFALQNTGSTSTNITKKDKAFTIDGISYDGMILAKDKVHTLTIPEGYIITKVTVYCYVDDNDAKTSYWTTFGSYTYSSRDEAVAAGHAITHNRKETEQDQLTFNFDEGVTNTLKFKATGKTPVILLVVDYNDTNVYLTLDKTVGYTTYYGDKALTIPSDVKVYTAQYSDSELKLSQITTGAIPVNTAVIISGTPGATATFITTSETVAAITNNDLQGVATDTQKEDVYVLSYKEGLNDIGFYHATSRTIPAHKVYFEMPTKEGNAPVLRFNFGQTSETDNVSGIEAVTIEDREEQVIYDLRGRRV